MSLSDLPDEILNLISIRLNGFDNYFLWMASDSKLRQRLVNNVITDIDIKYTIPGRYLWPGNFLKKLKRLSRLSLVVDPTVYHLPIENVELFPINTLKHLNLEYPGLTTLLEKEPSHFMGPTASSNSDFINLNDLYCNLEHLELNFYSFSDMPIDFLRILPQKLKRCFLRQTFFELDQEDPEDSVKNYISLLPHTLTELEIRFDHNSEPIYFDPFQLLPNLTSLSTNLNLHDSPDDMTKCFKIFDLATSSSKTQKSVPDRLQTFQKLYIQRDVNDDTLYNSSQLIQNMENLEHITLDLMTLKLHEMITKCPKNLKTFNCFEFQLKHVPTALFGPYLTKIHLTHFTGFKRELIAAFPTSLTDLTISLILIDYEAFNFFELLPKNLKLFATNCKIVENMSLLPEGLTFLSLTPPKAWRCDSLYFDRLPGKLEIFICTNTFPQSLVTKLPETLKFLDLSDPLLLVDDKVVRMLPRGLKKLRLDTSDKITNAGASEFPPNMTTLYLINNTTMTDDAIHLLPRNLMFLNLRANPNLTDECVKHLPRNLIDLYCLESTNITSKSCQDFPKYMRSLSLPKCTQWDTDIVGDLPYYLTEMSLGNTQTKNAWINVLRQRGRYQWYKSLL